MKFYLLFHTNSLLQDFETIYVDELKLIQSTNETNENSKILIRLKGDGNEYQFKIKDKSDVLYSYMTTFETSGKWETIEIKLSDLYLSYRGLRQQNSSKNSLFLHI